MAASHITVYSREACHLCEEALQTIRAVIDDVDQSVTITEVDVDEDPELQAKYGERVPYVVIDGRPAFKFRVDEAALRTHLATTDDGASRSQPAREE